MCWPAFNKLLGVSRRSTCKSAHGGIDLRRKVDGAAIKPQGAPQQQKVHEFFLGLYRSAAEPMPHESYMVKGCVDQNIEFEEDPWALARSGANADSDEDEATDIWNPDRPLTSDLAAFLGGDVGVARRYLSNGTLTSLYWLMVSTHTEEGHTNDDVPSWATFHRAWSSSWRKCLRFRKKHQHADCKQCFSWRERLHKCSGVAERLDLAREWRLHLRATYHDRMIYWWCRYASRHSMDVLTIIIDSMDKAKFAWPQYPWGRVDKTLTDFHRPRLCVTAGIAHGYCTAIYVADDELSHGSNAFCDVLVRLLENVWRQCAETGKKFPRHLVVQSDNTTAQAKNSYVAVFLSFLVSKYKFATANLFFLQVGHTHEDIGASTCLVFCCFRSGVAPSIVFVLHVFWRSVHHVCAIAVFVHGLGPGVMGQVQLHSMHAQRNAKNACNMPDQLFGVILELILRRVPFQVVSELIQRLRETLASRVEAKGESLYVEELFHIRDFNQWLAPIDITLYNAWVSREGRFAPHAFTYKLRQDLTRKEQGMMMRRDRGFHGDPRDVFVCVKAFMHSTEVKKPVMVLPVDRARRVVQKCPGVLVEDAGLTAHRAQELLNWAAVLERPQYGLGEAADALRALVHDRPPGVVCPAPWLERDEAAPAAVLHDTGNAMFAHLPDTSWDLLVTFHRGA